MGMPLNSFTVLKTIAEGKVNSHEYRDVKEALRTFRLFAFILHDPQEHPAFDKALSAAFERLDFSTQEELLFFALVNAPGGWHARAKSRKYYQRFQEISPNTVKERSMALDGTIASAFSLASTLNIPADDLPCLVVTDDLFSKEYWWFKTCPEHLETQLNRLAYVSHEMPIAIDSHWRAEWMPGRGDLSHRLADAQIDLCDGEGTAALEMPLARALTEVLSFLAMQQNDPAMRFSGKRLSNAALQRLRLQIEALHQSLQAQSAGAQEDAMAAQIERLKEEACNFLALDIEGQTSESSIPPVIPLHFLEPDSRQTLATASVVLKALRSDDSSLRLEGWDFSPAVLCLTKVFEKEINLSAVHWIRQALGITMPDYYNKYQKGVTAVRAAKTGGPGVDFNMARNKKWLPPGIGQSELIFANLADNQSPPWMLPAEVAMLKSEWTLIRQWRNRAAHTEMLTDEVATTVNQSLEHLTQKHIFDRLARLKKLYRGDPVEETLL